MEHAIIPDLHGDVRSLEKILNHYPIPFIFLGDIVDRGESSYETFLLVNEKLHKDSYGVASNHDNKFYRWLKKWKSDEYQDHPYYGMTAAHGLQGTIFEFLSLHSSIQDDYCDKFIQYYVNRPAYIKRSNHYFVHAGLHHSMNKETYSSKQRKGLYADCIYKTTTIEEWSQLVEQPSILHVGHVADQDKPYIRTEELNGYQIVQHDIGLGKFIKLDEFNLENMIKVVDV